MTGRVEPPAGRRPAVDVARVLALVIVVLGHLMMAVVDLDDGDIRGDNLFELEPGWAWLAALAPMPVFFAAGGWANATSTPRSSARRLASLVGTACVAVAIWSTAVMVAKATTGSEGLVGRGARLATQPLWFLAAYVPFAAAGSVLAGLMRRRPGLCLGSVFGGLAVIDALRFGADGPPVIGWIGFPLAWAAPWLLGAWWRDRSEADRFAERRVGAVLLVAGLGVGWALVALLGYTASLIDVSDEARSNTTPPGLYTAVIGAAQVGAFMVAARHLDRVGARWWRFWDRAGNTAVGIYVWHLTALSICVGLLALGAPAPERLTTLWWATRPVWFAAVIAVTAALTLATAAGRTLLRGDVEHTPTTTWALAGVVAATGGATAVGLVGPRSVGYGIACTSGLAAGWWLLRGPAARDRPAPERQPRGATGGPRW